MQKRRPQGTALSRFVAGARLLISPNYTLSRSRWLSRVGTLLRKKLTSFIGYSDTRKTCYPYCYANPTVSSAPGVASLFAMECRRVSPLVYTLAYNPRGRDKCEHHSAQLEEEHQLRRQRPGGRNFAGADRNHRARP